MTHPAPPAYCRNQLANTSEEEMFSARQQEVEALEEKEAA
jgi:hypothetical protein